MADPKTGIVVDDVHEDARAAVEELKKAQEPEESAEPVKEPVKEPEASATERARGPDGKFVKKDEAKEPEAQAAPAPEKPAADGAQPQGGAQELPPVPPPAAGPPPGWSVPAKAAWEKIPPEVRDAIAKREQEVSSGFKQYEGLRPFAERAAKGGQSLANVVQAYVAMEDTLRRDPAKGFASLAERLGMTQHEYAQFSLQQAQRYGAAPQSNENPAPVQDMNTAPQGFDPNALAPHIQRVVQEALRPFEQTLNQTVAVNRDAQTRAIETALERFRSDPAHRYFANVEDSIAQLFEAGIVPRTGDYLADLAKAYDIACWQNPEIRPLLINEQNAKAEESRKQRDREIAAKAKNAGKSITGASVPAAIVPNPGEDDVTAAARAAYRQHALG